VEEQSTFAVIVLVVEVIASRQLETLQSALLFVRVLYGVRCVRAAHFNVGVVRLAELRCHHHDNDQLA